MRQIEFSVKASGRYHDAAIVMPDEDPRTALTEAVVQALSIDIMVKVGETEMHLAGWMDPEHWESDWREIGVEDVDDLVSEAIVEGRV